MKTKRNARFFTFIRNDIVKLTLRPGQTLCHAYRSRDEEGFSDCVHKWTHDGNGVVSQYDVSGRDCDGWAQRKGTIRCPLEKLKSGNVDCETGLPFPEWDDLSSEQRDEFAELAGY
jgi:hypothetical protein